MKCEHENFEAHVAVNRLEETDGGGITGYAADITIKCAHCETPFQFLGLPGGLVPDRATCSVDCLEARLPIAPQGEVVRPFFYTGFGVKMH